MVALRNSVQNGPNLCKISCHEVASEFLTISTKYLNKDNSKFDSEFFIKLPTTFVLNDFSYEQLKIVEKFSLDRLFQLDRFAEGYYKFENIKVGSFKNSQSFTEDSNFM